MKTFQDYLADLIRQAGGEAALPPHLRRALEQSAGESAEARIEMMVALVRHVELLTGARFAHVYRTEAFRDGRLLWRDETSNLVTNEGLNDILSKYWKGSGYTASHFIGLTAGSPTPAAGDTMASHLGWTEVTAYSETNRQGLTLGAVASQSVDNSASKGVFTINAGSTTVGGAFVTTNNTKGGTTGLCIGVAGFTGGNRTVQSGDVINVTATLTAASA